MHLAFLYHQKPKAPKLTRQAMAFRPTLHHDPSSEPDCYVCRRMNSRKPTIQVGGSATCLLCNKVFCERHKGKEEGVCETNHVSYYRNHPLRWGTISPSLEARKDTLGERGSLVDESPDKKESEETIEERAKRDASEDSTMSGSNS